MKHKQRWYSLLILLVLLIGVGCAKDENTSGDTVTTPVSEVQEVLHTSVQLQVFNPDAEDIISEAFDLMKRYEDQLTTNKEGSDVYQINQAAGDHAVSVHPDTFEIINRGLKIAEESDGLFDITIGPINELWRIGEDDARVPEANEIQAALPLVNYQDVELNEEDHSVFLKRPNMKLELGGISKGYIGSKVIEFLESKGVTNAIANLGGNVALLGDNPSNPDGWAVGIQDPTKERNQVVGKVMSAGDRAVVTSGIYERYIEEDGKTYHHILDPKTGYPVETNITSVSVFAPSSFEGDAYSTALFALGIDKGIDLINQKEGFEALYIDDQKNIYLSDGLKDKLEITNEQYHVVES